MRIVDKMTGTIPKEYKGLRLDKALALMYPDYSRSVIQKWLARAWVAIDDEILSQKQRLDGGERIEIQLPEQQSTQWQPQEIPVDVLYEDKDVLVVNKPAGLVVHPGAGNPDGTLLNGLLFYDQSLAKLPRAGIVHRLDKDTSGLMVVARNESARLRLIEKLQLRDVSRKYLTLVSGIPISGGTVDAPISRHPVDRKRMAVNDSGKQAITHYLVRHKFRNHALLLVKLETGRTHQIRVHMQSIGYPVLGDPVYSSRTVVPKKASVELSNAMQSFKRQALHAWKLSFVHPKSAKQMKFNQPMPDDMALLVTLLKQNC